MALAMDAKKSYKLARAKRIACELSVTDPGTHVLASLQANVKVIEAAQLDQVNLMCNLKNLLPRASRVELGEYSEAVDALGIARRFCGGEVAKARHADASDHGAATEGRRRR